MSYSRWSSSRWYTFWSAMGAETTEFKWPTRKLKEGQVFEICDMPSYHITYGDLKRRSRSAVLHEIEEHFAQDFEWTDMEGTTHVSRSVPPTWDELMELQDYFVQFINDVDNHFKFWTFMQYEWYYPLRNKIIWKIKKLKQHMNKETGNPIFKTTNDDIINSRIIYIKTQNADPIFRVSTEYDKLSTDEKIKMLDSLNNWVNGEIMSILKEKYKTK